MAIRQPVKRNGTDDPLSKFREQASGPGQVNILIYGLSGVGKTTLLGSAQDCELTSPMLFLDIEGGTLSVADKGIDIIRPQNFKDIQEVYDYLRFENKKYRSVGIDSVTEIQRKLSMGDILGVLEDDASYTNLANHVPADRYDWLSSGEQMRRFIRAFRDLAYLPDRSKRIHVLITALERLDEKSNKVCPALPGQLGLEIGASVDVLARMTVRETVTGEGDASKTVEKRHLSMRNVEEDGLTYLGRIRGPESAQMPTHLWRPTVSRILALWKTTERRPPSANRSAR